MDNDKYFDDMRELMLMDGWKHLVSELTTNANVIDSVVNTKDENELQFRKGQLNIIMSRNVRYALSMQKE